ncbi:hypothetical protein PMAYCL1PPCAC_07167, partial [Pristionchus mayeri]
KDIERLEKEEEKGKRKEEMKRPKMLLIRTRVEDESAFLPLHSSSPSFPLPDRVVVPHAVAPPRRDHPHPVPILKDRPTENNNCTASTDWCAALSVCLIEATSSERRALDQMSLCQQKSFSMARTFAVVYGECLMNESCTSSPSDCLHPSSLPIMTHCPSYFSECSQLASCCPLTHRCSRLFSSSPSSFSLDASCLLCSPS